MRLRLRRRKPAPLPVRPVQPLRVPEVEPAVQLANSINDAVSQLAKAIRTYALAPDEIPAPIRADYATNIAFGALVDLLAGVHESLRPGEMLHVEHRQKVLYALVVAHGIQDLLSTTADVAELWGRNTQATVDEWVELISLWTYEAAHLVQAPE